MKKKSIIQRRTLLVVNYLKMRMKTIINIKIFLKNNLLFNRMIAKKYQFKARK